MDYTAVYSSPMGNIRLFSDGQALTGLYTEFWCKRQDKDFGAFENGDELDVIKQTKRWLEIYFAGKEPDFVPPLAPAGSVFRKEVWNILRSIPYGKVMTYGEIAKLMALRLNKEKMSAQAVGGAVGANPIGIIIPCHRVIGAHGNLTGYAGGLVAKRALLELEGIDTSKLLMPKSSRFL
ncbi:MAG: methylated-DNA--[protein]-cysteine S-methyltransferase [Alphaproteobacteria bacterium]|nr:methylated-DNA--[protein]-cysteine S-methyltransferase [Alphaproteobacteria bacterium]MBO5441032.1 methylated-DNA--[protein]-cysteine S-methyltransferase [Alphaproteobacteria bacterium]MBP3687621.1 methylated-DNA--[protein]-cysteine S-methyltransferase [Alphaproteobacteria bacterium]